MRRGTWIRMAAGAAALLLTAAARAAEEHASETNIFNGDIGNFIFTLIIFGLVVFLLGKFAWKPVLTVLHDREKTIRESLESARTEREKAAQFLHEYEAQLNQARNEAAALVDEGRRDAEAVRQRMLADTRRETAEAADRARREIELAAAAAIKELYDKTAELSVDVAGRILQKKLSMPEHRQLVDESIAEMRASGRVKLN